VDSGAITLQNICIGDYPIIAARAVGTKDFPFNCAVMGNPAMIVKEFNPRHKQLAEQK
jgi:acetyltransferase-like isoleucine patch superfamily enzyme